MTDLIKIEEVTALRVPMDLLLQADPSKTKVEGYLRQSRCFIATLKGQVIGACAVKQVSADVHELMNISVAPEHQKKVLERNCFNM